MPNKLPGPAGLAKSKTKPKTKKAGLRGKLMGYAASPKTKQVTTAIIPAAEMIGAASVASALAAYRKAQGKDLKLGPVDLRIVAGLGLHVLGLWKPATNTHLVNLGTGLLGSFLIDKARDYGDAMVAKAGASATTETKTAETPVTESGKGVVVGEIDESGAVKWPWSKAGKKQRQEKRIAHLDEKEARIAQGKPTGDTRRRPRQDQTTTKRKILVIPAEGDYHMAAGKYHKVGALANW